MRQLVFLALGLTLLVACTAEVGDFSITNGTQSGSYANMLAIDDFLYIISESDLTTYDITNKETPTEIKREVLDATVESLFYSKGQLFVGSKETLFIYEIGTDGIPVRASTTSYGQTDFGFTCFSDPVVVNDSIAYVTLSTTSIQVCGGTIRVDELRLYDIKDITNPELLSTIPLENPKGLGLDDNLLFICDDGLKVFDVSDIADVQQIHHFPGFESFDVIAKNGLLLVVGPDNLYQYDYSTISDMALISTIEL